MKLNTSTRKNFRIRNKLKKVADKDRYKGKGVREKGQYVLKKEGKKK